MKKIIIAILLASSSSCFACWVNTSESPKAKAVLKANGSYPLSDAQCMFMKQRGLSLSIDGNATVLDGTSVAWSIIRLIKTKTGVNSPTYSSSTKVNSRVASQDVADAMLYESISDSIAAFNFVQAANEIESYGWSGPTYLRTQGLS